MNRDFSYLFSSFMIGMVGFGFFMYGKKKGGVAMPLIIGIAL